MVEDDQIPEAAGIKLADIYFVLFRHKWKILFISLLGVAAAGALYLAYPRVYISEAELLIRYIVERNSVSATEDQGVVKSPDYAGDSIMSAERQILTSFDLLREVAVEIGPERILGSPSEAASTNEAADVISKSLRVEAPGRGNILFVQFRHIDPALVQPVVKKIIELYQEKHLKVHREKGLLYDYLTRQADTARDRLKATESELRKVQQESGVISIEETQKAYFKEIGTLLNDLLTTEAEYEQRKAALGSAPAPTPSPEGVEASAPASVGLPEEAVRDYLSRKKKLEDLNEQHAELILDYKELHPEVRQVNLRIQEVQKLLEAMEAVHPQLADISHLFPATGTNGLAASLRLESTSIKDLETRISILKSQMAKLRTEAGALEVAAAKITDLKRQKQLDEENFNRFSAGAENAKLDEAMGAGKVSGISPVQEPTPPTQEASKLKKLVAMVLVGSFGFAVGLAFLIEMLFDTSLKRPSDLESKLQWSSSFTMPRVSRRDWRRATRRNRKSQARAADSGNGTIAYNEVTWKNGSDKLPPWSEYHPLRPHFEALRDQLIAEFELGNVIHKPKMVAVTSCSKGSGASTLATGLAASLSETGGGNVLLVDMNQKDGAAHTLYKGKPGAVGFPDALEQGKRDAALIHQNLYAVSATQNVANPDDTAPRILPRRFNHLMPKIKASDYDFIIFDMPPVDQISLTARLSGFMDKVLLVLESEKTSKSKAKRAASLLQGCKADVSPVLNKYHRYVPEALDEDA